jgi:hypothetical protein
MAIKLLGDATVLRNVCLIAGTIAWSTSGHDTSASRFTAASKRSKKSLIREIPKVSLCRLFPQYQRLEAILTSVGRALQTDKRNSKLPKILKGVSLKESSPSCCSSYFPINIFSPIIISAMPNAFPRTSFDNEVAYRAPTHPPKTNPATIIKATLLSTNPCW